MSFLHQFCINFVIFNHNVHVSQLLLKYSSFCNAFCVANFILSQLKQYLLSHYLHTTCWMKSLQLLLQHPLISIKHLFCLLGSHGPQNYPKPKRLFKNQWYSPMRQLVSFVTSTPFSYVLQALQAFKKRLYGKHIQL